MSSSSREQAAMSRKAQSHESEFESDQGHSFPDSSFSPHDGDIPISVQRAVEDLSGMPWDEARNHPSVTITMKLDPESITYAGASTSDPGVAQCLGTRPTGPSQNATSTFIRSGFRYTRLPDRHIRLMRVCAMGSTPLVEIQDYPIDNCPEYQALSYAWEPQGATRIFMCNNDSFVVPETVHYALNCISMTQTGGFKVWIDSICINQEDEQEKATQVAIMGEIYARAQGVLVWLGPAQDDSDLALTGMAEIGAWLEQLLRTHGPRLPDDPPPYHSLLSPRVLPGLGRIYTRPWFSRVWVVQEVLRAKHAVFMCGNKRFQFDGFMKLTALLVELQMIPALESPAVPKGLIEFGVRNMYLLGCLKDIPQPPFETHPSYNFTVILEASRPRNVTEPVDRIWAFLGLAPSELRDLANPLISYSKGSRKGYHRAYIKLCKLLFASGGGIPLLSSAPPLKKHRGLPSWCPDFNSPPSMQVTRLGTSLALNGMPYNADASGTNRPTPYFRLGSNALRLVGFRVDYVKCVIPSDKSQRIQQYRLVKYDPPLEAIAQWEKLCLDLALKTYRTENDDVQKAHWRTLTVDYMWRYHPPSEESDLLIGQAYHDYRRYINAHDGAEVKQSLPIERQARLARFARLVGEQYGRTYFSTTGGRVGLGVPGTQPGDCIVIIRGARTPFLLRRGPAGVCRLPSTQLVGEAYVEGFMYGELRNQAQDETFCIK